jgi:hypothetical protein
MAYNYFKTKSLSDIMPSSDGHEGNELKRTLGAANLVALGVGAIIGTGIFTLTGQAAAEHTGPALVISFIIAGIGCGFAGLCYAEFAAMIPVSGSAYTYSYATLGEIGVIADLVELPFQLLAKVQVNNREVLIPLVEDFILDIQENKKVIYLTLPDGLLSIN